MKKYNSFYSRACDFSNKILTTYSYIFRIITNLVTKFIMASCLKWINIQIKINYHFLANSK